MKCPHCRTAFNLQNAGPVKHPLGADREHFWELIWVKCPECERFVVRLMFGPAVETQSQGGRWDRTVDPRRGNTLQVHPQVSARPVPAEVPDEYGRRFQQAVQIVSVAPEASAALSRRLLQDLIRSESKITLRTLSEEIDALLESGVLPPDLVNEVDAIRQVGNFGAHSIKSQSTGQIVEVEPGEADWLLDILEDLFHFYFVRPKVRQRRRERLNSKLADAGKPPLKAA